MRDFSIELSERTKYLTSMLASAGASGFVYGNSGGKDSALVGILLKRACDNTVGVALPCSTRRNFSEDLADAERIATQYSIELRTIDVTPARDALVSALEGAAKLTDAARMNIAPRIRMAALYAIAAAENRLVVGTDNRSEIYMGYYTKWGDGAYDINPIADLTATEVYDFLRHLGAPASILEKAPSAGLFEGQTDETEMGVRYETLDRYLLTGEAGEAEIAIMARQHRASEHKRSMPSLYTPSESFPIF